MAHFIIKNAKKYDEPTEERFAPGNGFYDCIAGYWKDNDCRDILVGTDVLNRMNSKKCDRETGEDQKGE